ncbi:lipocalin family protein [Chitinispirillales bacterium ANBcel5]|uniref:lipocalin family protein n=1 Tax=Cellulosispirillum alkaliphilum TaxID=3039283 RepID=UPI002A57FA3A|nr:lipocalin family protein [Chitinispirillales bacterium ANBcel5]
MIRKKALFSTLFVALFILSGCSNPFSSDGNGGDVNLAHLEGTWEAVKDVYTDVDGYAEEYTYEEGDATLTFNFDGSGMLTVNIWDRVRNTETYSYTVSGNNLIVDGESITIVELTSSTLVIRVSYEGETNVVTFRKI